MDWGGGIGPAIADTIQQMGRTRAQGAAAKGQLIGRSLSEIGQFFANAPQRQALQDERQARTLGLQALTEQRQQTTQDRQRSAQGREALMGILADPSVRLPDGSRDPVKVMSALESMGFQDVAQSYAQGEKTRGDIGAQMRAAAKTRRDASIEAYDTAARAIHASPNAVAAESALVDAVEAGLLDPDEANQFSRKVQSWSDFRAGADAFFGQSTQGRKDAEERGKVFNTPHVLGAGQVLVLPGQDGQSAQTIATGPPKAPTPEKPPTAGTFEDYLTRYAAERKRPVQSLSTKDVEDARKRYMQADDKAGAQAAADVTALTPGGLDITALNFRKTGIMPSLGLGDKGTRQRIINRAAELTPEDMQRIEAGGADLAANAAGYKADAGSLKTIQQQRDTIGAFEQTAQKNIDTFLDVAKNVTDTGIPLLNTPARWVAGAAGSAAQAKYAAARQVAVSEIAKIVQNPTLAGQLSDSARHEIEVFNPQNATLAQTVAVMQLLKRDMENRATSLDEQLKTIKGRIGGGQPKSDPLGIR